jgi:hypothetical protein
MAEEVLESYTSTVEEEPTVEKSNQILSEDMQDVIKAALIDALKDHKAAKVLSEQLAVRVIPCIKNSDNDRVPASLRKLRKGNFWKNQCYNSYLLFVFHRF